MAAPPSPRAQRGPRRRRLARLVAAPGRAPKARCPQARQKACRFVPRNETRVNRKSAARAARARSDSESARPIPASGRTAPSASSQQGGGLPLRTDAHTHTAFVNRGRSAGSIARASGSSAAASERTNGGAIQSTVEKKLRAIWRAPPPRPSRACARPVLLPGRAGRRHLFPETSGREEHGWAGCEGL